MHGMDSFRVESVIHSHPHYLGKYPADPFHVELHHTKIVQMLKVLLT
jgi:hypothetical protein